MRDKELSYWTCRGVQTAGFFVATIDDEVVGTVSYIREVGSWKSYLLTWSDLMSRMIIWRFTDCRLTRNRESLGLLQLSLAMSRESGRFLKLKKSRLRLQVPRWQPWLSTIEMIGQRFL